MVPRMLHFLAVYFRFKFVRKRLTAKRLLIITSICLFITINKVHLLVKPKTSNLKYILMWTSKEQGPFKYWKTEQQEFKERKCRFANCYLTRIRQKLDHDLSNFDAIIFNGRNLQYGGSSDLPTYRSYHQKYIFLNLESSDNQPICSLLYDEFFNWTATYKLNSDIEMPYVLIRNRRGDEVGPRIDMTWVDMFDFNETLLQSFKKRTKAAAWFVSHCHTRSRREEYAKKLKSELKKLNLTLDVYGKCGDVTLWNEHKWNDLLRNNYFFYLSFENSIAEDYITEKLSTAVRNDVVPILYGGANYSRFLPPGSYIDARKYEPKELASVMAQLIGTPAAYNHFFRWKNHYTYHRPEHVCRLCAALNNQTMVNTLTEYKEFRHWWNPDYVRRCEDRSWGS